MEEQRKESSRNNESIDIDVFLQSKGVCHLGTSPEKDARSGNFARGSRVFATLGGRFGHKDTRVVFFGRGGQVTIAESMQTVDCVTGATLGRETTGGDAVSNMHVRVSVANDRYELKDLDSTNGTDVFKPKRVRTDVELDIYTENIAVIERNENFRRAFIAFGKEGDGSLVSVTKLPTGDFLVTDAVTSRRHHARRLTTVGEGQAITIGKGSRNFPEHLVGERLNLPDEGIEVAQLRLFVKDGDIFILNLANKPFGVGIERMNEKPQYQEAPKKPEPEKQKQTPQEPQKPKRIPTIKLWQQLEKEILDLEKGSSDPEKLYKRMARKYHPDLNQGDPNANRRMQLINKYFDR